MGLTLRGRNSNFQPVAPAGATFFWKNESDLNALSNNTSSTYELNNSGGPHAYPVHDGLYSVSITLPGGCSFKEFYAVNISPSVYLEYDKNTVCVGDTLRVKMSGAESKDNASPPANIKGLYSWDPHTGSPIFSSPVYNAKSNSSSSDFASLSSGTYNFTLTGEIDPLANDNCAGSSVTTPFSVTVKGAFTTVSPGTSPYTINNHCSADVDLCPTGCMGHQYHFTWYPSEGVSDMHGSHVTICRPAVTTTYTVSVIDLDTTAANDYGCCGTVEVVAIPGTDPPCDNTDPCYNYIPPQRKEEKQNLITLKLTNNWLVVSPNPTDGRIIIQWNEDEIGVGNKLFRIFDIRGRDCGQIAVTEMNGNRLNLDLSQLPAGVYFAQLTGGKKRLIGKIFKQ